MSRRTVIRLALLAVLLVAALVGAAWAGTALSPSAVGPRPVGLGRSAYPALMIYVRNFDPNHISNRTLRDDIPAWEAAANGKFRQVWHTPRARIVLLEHGQQPPTGGIVADITSHGPVKGALAYHTQNRGRPAIVVYAGADDYYGYSDSVSFTHEMFELLADEHTASINQGWPVDNITLDRGQFQNPEYITVPPGQLFINEVCDPVEASHYTLSGADGRKVWVSDWITPNWFNDEQQVPAGVPEFDYMGLVQQPLTILRGGYASLFVVDFFTMQGPYTGWVSVENFRHAGRDPGGYMDDTRDGPEIGLTR